MERNKQIENERNKEEQNTNPTTKEGNTDNEEIRNISASLASIGDDLEQQYARRHEGICERLQGYVLQLVDCLTAMPVALIYTVVKRCHTPEEHTDLGVRREESGNESDVSRQNI